MTRGKRTQSVECGFPTLWHPVQSTIGYASLVGPRLLAPFPGMDDKSTEGSSIAEFYFHFQTATCNNTYFTLNLACSSDTAWCVEYNIAVHMYYIVLYE